MKSVTSDLEFWLGHGTRNDFVLVVDPDGEREFDAAIIRALCDRRSGLGGDGWIRLVRTAAVPQWAHLIDEQPAAQWFMDYRNSDGSIAEMCGNGVRVFAHLLEILELADFSGDRPTAIGTRAGIRWVQRTAPARYRVGMGQWKLSDDARAKEVGSDATVSAIGLDLSRPGLSVDMGNPHTVVALASTAELMELDLTHQPDVAPEPPHGTNVEFIVPGGVSEDAGQAHGQLQMRVFERGVGETQSCGTGACAAAVAARFWMGESGPGVWDVQVPGGTVTVALHDDGHVDLEGPAAIVAHGTVDLTAVGE